MTATGWREEEQIELFQDGGEAGSPLSWPPLSPQPLVGGEPLTPLMGDPSLLRFPKQPWQLSSLSTSKPARVRSSLVRPDRRSPSGKQKISSEQGESKSMFQENHLISTVSSLWRENVTPACFKIKHGWWEPKKKQSRRVKALIAS